MPGHYLARNGQLPDEVADLLFRAWVQKLASDRLLTNQSGTSGSDGLEIFTFGAPDLPHFSLVNSPAGFIIHEIENYGTTDVEEILDEALSRTLAADTGEDLVYEASLKIGSASFAPSNLVHFARSLGDGSSFTGQARLSDKVVLDFHQAEAAPLILTIFAPAQEIRVLIFVPGPTASELSTRIASTITETVAAICALALGRPVDFEPAWFPVDDVEQIRLAFEKRKDSAIGGLVRDDVSLDVFDELFLLGHTDAVLRVRGSLLAYHAALQQANPDVAVMLFVTAIEALIAPRPTWGKLKVTARFRDALIDLCPSVVDAIVEHPNSEMAFEWKRRGNSRRRRRELLEEVYASRSIPNHNGPGVSSLGMSDALVGSKSQRMALASQLARGAILAYIQSPRSYLIGHPLFEPADTSSGCAGA